MIADAIRMNKIQDTNKRLHFDHIHCSTLNLFQIVPFITVNT